VTMYWILTATVASSSVLIFTTFVSSLPPPFPYTPLMGKLFLHSRGCRFSTLPALDGRAETLPFHVSSCPLFPPRPPPSIIRFLPHSDPCHACAVLSRNKTTRCFLKTWPMQPSAEAYRSKKRLLPFRASNKVITNKCSRSSGVWYLMAHWGYLMTAVTT
jgi:hypothetical protein